MNDGMKRDRTWPSAIMFLLLAIGIIILIGVIVYALTQPGVFEATLKIILIAIAAIAALVIIGYAIIALISIPMYAMKGESYQTDVSYDLEQIEPVKEKGLDKDEEE